MCVVYFGIYIGVFVEGVVEYIGSGEVFVVGIEVFYLIVLYGVNEVQCVGDWYFCVYIGSLVFVVGYVEVVVCIVEVLCGN